MEKLAKIKNINFYKDAEKNQDHINSLAKDFFFRVNKNKKSAFDFMSGLRANIGTDNLLGFCVRDSADGFNNFDLCLFDKLANGEVEEYLYEEPLRFYDYTNKITTA